MDQHHSNSRKTDKHCNQCGILLWGLTGRNKSNGNLLCGTCFVKSLIRKYVVRKEKR